MLRKEISSNEFSANTFFFTIRFEYEQLKMCTMSKKIVRKLRSKMKLRLRKTKRFNVYKTKLREKISELVAADSERIVFCRQRYCTIHSRYSNIALISFSFFYGVNTHYNK